MKGKAVTSLTTFEMDLQCSFAIGVCGFQFIQRCGDMVPDVTGFRHFLPRINDEHIKAETTITYKIFQRKLLQTPGLPELPLDPVPVDGFLEIP